MFANAVKKSIIFLSLCLIYSTQAQVRYSTKIDYLKIKEEKNNLISHYQNAFPDTLVTELSNFFPRNFMGNIGLPAPNYMTAYGTENLGFRFFDAPTDNDRFKDRQVEYYRTRGPYASLTGIAGSKQLQAFKLLFTHTYKDKINITLKLNRYSSMGYYKRQQTYANNFFLSSDYTATHKRFGYYFYVLNNGNRNQENGGIRDGILTDSTVQISKELLPVALSAANRDNRETKFMVNPWFRLNRRTDSLSGADHYMHLKSTASFDTYRYRDSRIKEDNYYKLFYLDTLSTKDSSNVRQLSNELGYSLVLPDERFVFSVGYKNEINRVWQKADSVFLNHIVSTDFIYRTNTKLSDTIGKAGRGLELSLNAQYIAAGSNEGNYKIENKNRYYFNRLKNWTVFLNLLYEERNPDYIYNYWISNHFQWFNNKYKPLRQIQAHLGVSLGNSFSASFFYRGLNNYLYFDEVAAPKQFSNNITNLCLHLEYKKILLKHLGVSASYTFQNTSQEKYIRLPQNSGTAKLFYNGNLFKNNLQLQIGSQVQVYQSFVAYSYMPSTQVFYLQNNFKTETYPFVDVYLNARIRPVSFFLKLENVLNGRLGTNYAFVPGYYQNDLAFRFGLTWTFFD